MRIAENKTKLKALGVSDLIPLRSTHILFVCACVLKQHARCICEICESARKKTSGAASAKQNIRSLRVCKATWHLLAVDR